MKFTPIDKENWPRREYFEHYFQKLPCTYSLTAELDITALLAGGEKLYPAMLYLLSTVVNRHEEFRTAINSEGVLGVFDSMNPSYTVFHSDTETFSTLWTEYDESRELFKRRCEADMKAFGAVHKLTGKPDAPENCFPVSMIPWTGFTGFNLNLAGGFDYLLPIFTMGRYSERSGRAFLPLSVQVHHAVCDGFHLSRFLKEVQALIDQGRDSSR